MSLSEDGKRYNYLREGNTKRYAPNELSQGSFEVITYLCRNGSTEDYLQCLKEWVMSIYVHSWLQESYGNTFIYHLKKAEVESKKIVEITKGVYFYIIGVVSPLYRRRKSVTKYNVHYKNDDRGHVIANVFGGSCEKYNLVSQHRSCNRGKWLHYFDSNRHVAERLKISEVVEGEIVLEYGGYGDSHTEKGLLLLHRPNRFVVTINGRKIVFENNNVEQKELF